MNFCRTCVFVIILLPLVALPTVTWAQTTDYTELSLEELTAVRIFTLGRKQATLFDTPNAASVVTGDDLRRSGSLNLADALRVVPGMQVNRIDSFNYGISTRGFNDARGNKLLVLMDGRSLYSTTSTGAYWNYHELMIEDLDRIEVLRGPGASLWGANAMNGVVNIVSKPAEATLGSLLSVSHGDQLNAAVSLRQGFRLSDATAVRVYAKYQDHGSYGTTIDTGSAGWSNRLVGARLDWQRPGGGGLTLIGELRSLRISGDTEFPTLVAPYLTFLPETQRTRGGNISAHWVQPAFSSGELSLLATYEQIDSARIIAGEDRTTYGLDLQLTVLRGSRHEIITGLTYREDRDLLTESAWTRYREPRGRTIFTGAYLQDEISILPDRLSVTVGSKFERNSFSGWETQPSLRAILRTTKTQRSWIGISRAARTPSREEREVDLFGHTYAPSPEVPLPMAIHAIGSSDLNSEHVTAWEIGHRYEPNPRLSFDLALFYNRYDDVRGTTIGDTTFRFAPVPHLEQSIVATNNLHGTTHGGDLTVRWQPVPTLMIEGSLTAVRTSLKEHVPASPPDQAIAGLTGSTPKQEYKLRLQWDPLPRWSIDLALRHFDRLPGPELPSYTGVDARFAWRPRDNWEIDVIGRELLDPMHGELSKNFIGPQVRETARSFFLRATYRH
jgi:iron complex outermembrane receptor protein